MSLGCTRAFSAGADVRAVRDLVLAGDPVAAGDFWAREYALIGAGRELPQAGVGPAGTA